MTLLQLHGNRRFKQSLGLNDWDPLPEGVEYPEAIR